MLSTLILAALLQTLVDDFEDHDLQASSGLDWMVIADIQLGGASNANLAPIREATGGSGGALRLAGEIRDGFAAPFAGAWVPLDGRGFARDLSVYRGIRFRARGSGPTFLAGFRTGGARSANFMAEFTPAGSWSTFEIGFDDLAQTTPTSKPISWSTESVGWMGFQTKTGAKGAFWLELDDIELLERAPSVPQTRTVKVDVGSSAPLGQLEWRALADDAPGDGRFRTLPEARSLSYAIDGDLVWFRIGLTRALPEDFFGVNLAIDGDGDASNGTPWWGFNQEFRFDRLVTVYLTRVGRHYQGVVGITDAEGASRFELTNLGFGNVSVSVSRDASDPSVLVGIPRRELDSDGRFHAIATVGSAFIPNDDVPDRGYAEVSLKD